MAVGCAAGVGLSSGPFHGLTSFAVYASDMRRHARGILEPWVCNDLLALLSCQNAADHDEWTGQRTSTRMHTAPFPAEVVRNSPSSRGSHRRSSRTMRGDARLEMVCPRCHGSLSAPIRGAHCLLNRHTARRILAACGRR